MSDSKLNGGMNPENEADARILIDALLREAGWNPADKMQVRTEVPIAASLMESTSVIREEPVRAYVRCDYVLHDTDGHPLAVIEAKSGGIDPYIAKQQALPYAKRIRRTIHLPLEWRNHLFLGLPK